MLGEHKANLAQYLWMTSANSAPAPDAEHLLRSGSARLCLHAIGSLRSPVTPRAGKATKGSTRNDVLGMPAANSKGTTTQAAAVPAKQVRGVVLEFAPKLPTTRRKEVLLNA